MTKEPMTPAEAAEALYKLIPCRISVEMLSDYGIDATDEQAADMTREVLSFTLYLLHVWPIECPARQQSSSAAC